MTSIRLEHASNQVGIRIFAALHIAMGSRSEARVWAEKRAWYTLFVQCSFSPGISGIFVKSALLH